MASRPELPVMLAGGLIIAGGYAAEGKWPKYGTESLAAVGLLVLGVAAAGRTVIGPVVSALAWLFLLGVAYATIPALQAGNRRDARTRTSGGGSATNRPL